MRRMASYILWRCRAALALVLHPLFRIGVARKDCEGAVKLFGKHGAGQFVREGQRGQRKFLRGAAAQRFRKAFSATTQKNNFARAPVARFTEPLGELCGRLNFPSVVQQDNHRGRLEDELAQGWRRILPQFADLHFAKAPDPRQVVVA